MCNFMAVLGASWEKKVAGQSHREGLATDGRGKETPRKC